jgi:hypothetical protein
LTFLTTADEVRATGRIGRCRDALIGVRVAYLTGPTLLWCARLIVRIEDFAGVTNLRASDKESAVALFVRRAADGIEQPGAGVGVRWADTLAILTDLAVVASIPAATAVRRVGLPVDAGLYSRPTIIACTTPLFG